MENDRTAAILRGRRAGKTFSAIAIELGLNRSTVARLDREARNRIGNTGIDEHRVEALAELDEIGAALHPRWQDGDPQAIAQAIKLNESRRKLLGSDRPLQVAIEVAPPEPKQDALYAELRARLAVQSAVNALDQRAIEAVKDVAS